MSKDEYMKKLQERLENFGRELRDDIMEDYRQHFAEGELQGKTDEEIIEELGNIEDMVRDLPEEELEENIRKQLPDKRDDRISPYDGKVNTSGQQEAKYDYSGEYKEVVIQGEDADIFLEASEDDKIHVEYVNYVKDGHLRYEYYQYEEKGVFYCGIRNRADSGESMARGSGTKSWKMTLFGKTVISYNLNHGEGKALALTVKVPGGIPGISAKTSQGDIHGRQIACKEQQLISTSGDIHIFGADSDKIRVQAASGDIEADDIVCRGLFRIRTSSGDISMKKMELSQAEIKAVSGDVSVGDVSCTRTLALEAHSGDIAVGNITAEALNVQTSSGDISIASAKYKAGSVEASSGDISLANMEFETGSFTSQAGDIALANLRFKTGSFTSSQGDIAISNLEFETAKFTTESGDIAGCNTKAEFAGITAKRGDIALRDEGDRYSRAYQCRTESGDIVIHSGAEIYECIARGGDIDIEAAAAARKISAGSSAGDIAVKAKGTPESVNLKSENGDVSLELKETQGMEVTMDVGWGDGKITWAGKKSEMKKGTSVYGNGSSKVTVSSKRGDAEVCGGC